ncbi:hypothetical protein BZA05DRAFT_379146 [Tricharina praecox]|uniref:uncharacterized protein n=1 Tax=Tricharina praecox TaxID=43433 RepID=UPI00221E3F01|nr:uncharacterized protein BZA05DRAFT_379146 [Tricharina praecox]KAI5843723.1 hypothetical protein BZA05DRAFT_379146 [Tricharina praecox]
MTNSTPPTEPRSPAKCFSCGSDAHRNHDLEEQIAYLSDKVTIANAKIHAYESELRLLRPPISPSFAPPEPGPRSPSPANRISAFLFPTTALRRSVPPSPPPDILPTNASPASELAKERRLRIKAEEQLQQVTAELEDLSASLFQSANEMVAEERRARSKLEERVATLEKRDNDKRERLGVLERAVDRISRVREILTGGGSGDKEKDK